MKGVVYVATGKRYYQAAEASARSVREHAPGLRTHIFTDIEPTGTTAFDSIERVSNPHRRSKIDYLAQTPFDQALYLDADTRVCGDIAQVFDMLARFDMALAHAQNRIKTGQMRWRKDLPYAFPQLNTGVMVFNNTDKVRALLNDWRTAFYAAGLPKDQITFRELVWDSDLRVGVLPPEFNVKHRKQIRMWTKNEARPIVLHYESFVPGNKRLKLVRDIGRALIPERLRDQAFYNMCRSAYRRATGHGW